MPELSLKTCMHNRLLHHSAIHICVKKIVLVNTVKIQIYGNKFLLGLRKTLPVLADNI